MGINGDFRLIDGTAVEIHGENGGLHGCPPCVKMGTEVKVMVFYKYHGLGNDFILTLELEKAE